MVMSASFKNVPVRLFCDQMRHIHLNYQAMRRNLYAERNRMIEICVLHFTEGNYLAKTVRARRANYACAGTVL